MSAQTEEFTISSGEASPGLVDRAKARWQKALLLLDLRALRIVCAGTDVGRGDAWAEQ